MEAIEIDDAEVELDDRFIDLDVLMGQMTDTISPYLYQLIQEDCTCKSILAVTRSESNCDRVVECCETNPEQVFYASPVTGRTPLHEACLRGHCRHVIAALVGANPSGAFDRDAMRNTPLHLLFVDSTATLNPSETQYILHQMLQLNPTWFGLAINSLGETVLHMACRAPEAMINPHCLVELLAAHPTGASQRNSRNQSPLTLHCRRANASVQVAQLLVDASPRMLRICDGEKSWAPVHYAAATGPNFPLLEFLIEYHEVNSEKDIIDNATIPGIDPNNISINLNNRRLGNTISVRTANTSESALHLLLKHDNLRSFPMAIVEAYLNADPGAVTHCDAVHSKTPLHLLCQRSDVPIELVQLLLNTSRSAVSIADVNQYLPLHYACEVGTSPDVIALLLEVNPGSSHHLTRKQDTALSLACSANQNVETVRMLIQSNPAALTRKNDYGYAPVHCICRAFQPRMGIVEALVRACPDCVTLKTNAGETAMHLASSNTGAFIGIVKLLNTILHEETGSDSPSHKLDPKDKRMMNKVGNTPMHDACFRGAPFETLETLAMSNPQWITIRNLAGYTPLQILIKCGRLDERVVIFFAQLGGAETFSILDSTGNTPLHSAMRSDTDVATVRSLIRARPEAVQAKTIYGDTPLHLACLRLANPDVIREVVIASGTGRSSLVLLPNYSGQTPISIAMEEFRSSGCGGLCSSAHYSAPYQNRAFEILAIIVKVLFYGPQNYYKKSCSLVHACVSLHRRNVRLDPAFIRQVIFSHPGEAKMMDEHGSYPLHVEASIPVEKMALLDSTHNCTDQTCHKRAGVLRILLEVFPEATMFRNEFDEFPLGLMLQNGRVWGHTLALTLRAFPQALHWCRGVDDRILPYVLEKAGRECGPNTLFILLCNWPGVGRLIRET